MADLIEVLGGCDIVRHIRGFANVPAATLGLSVTDLLEEIGQMGYDPNNIVRGLAAYLRWMNKVRQEATKLTRFHQALSSLAHNGWSIDLAWDSAVIVLTSNGQIDDLVGLSLMLEHPVIVETSGDKWILRVESPDQLMTSLVYLDSRGRDGKIPGTYNRRR